MSIKVSSLWLSIVTALLVSGCATNAPSPTEEQLAHGVKVAGFHANVPLSTEFSRPHQIANAFGIRVNDVDPEDKIMSASEQGAVHSFINTTVNDGILAGVGAAAISAVKTSASYVRTEYDEWDAILDPLHFETIYAAQASALDNATQRTATGLRKQGYEVVISGHQIENGTGDMGIWLENRLILINAEKGCPKPTSITEAGCGVTLRTLYYNAASREAPPAWLSDLQEAFIIRSLAVLPSGKTAGGQPFALSREDREAIGREAGDRYYFYGAYDSDHAAFVGEDGEISFCHLTPEKLQKKREQNQKNLAEQFVGRIEQKFQKNWEERGVWGVLFPK